MTVMTHSKRTSELREGDVVRNHGMRLLIDQEITVGSLTPDHPERGNVRWTSARVLNPDEVERDGLVPASWIWRDRDMKRRDIPRWTIQGNDLATWAVEVTP